MTVLILSSHVEVRISKINPRSSCLKAQSAIQFICIWIESELARTRYRKHKSSFLKILFMVNPTEKSMYINCLDFEASPIQHSLGKFIGLDVKKSGSSPSFLQLIG